MPGRSRNGLHEDRDFSDVVIAMPRWIRAANRAPLRHPAELLRVAAGCLLARGAWQADAAADGGARVRGREGSPTSTSTIPTTWAPMPARRAGDPRPGPVGERSGDALLFEPRLQDRRLHQPRSGGASRGDRPDQARHRRRARRRQHPDDDLARPGRVRLRVPGRLRPAVGRRDRRHPRGGAARSGLHDQHRVQAQRAAVLQPAARLRHDAAGAEGDRPAEPRRHARLRARAVCRRAAGLRRRADRPAQPDPGAAPQRRLRQARRRADGGGGARAADGGAAAPGVSRRLRRADLLRHLPRSHRPRSGAGMRGQHRHGARHAAGRGTLDADNRLGAAMAEQDPVAAQRVVQDAMLGG